MGIGPVCLAKLGEVFTTDVIDLAYDDDLRDIHFRRDTNESAQEWESGETLHFNIPQVHRHHSPSGFEWGYAGSGPADFALNILAIFTDELPERPLPEWEYLWDKTRVHPLVWAWHQEFKTRFIAVAPRDGTLIPGSVIREFIRQQLAVETHNPEEIAVG